jgi:hypothetical protein
MIESQILIYQFSLSKLASNPPETDKMTAAGLKWSDRVKRDLKEFFKTPKFEKIQVTDIEGIDLYRQLDSLNYVLGGSWTPQYQFRDDGLTYALTQTILNSSQYLLNEFPKLPAEKGTPISDLTKAMYVRKFTIVNDPSMILEYLLMGFLGREDVKTCLAVYPELLNEIRLKATELTLDYPKLGWAKRKQLHILLGTQISTLSYQPPKEQGGGGGGGPSTSSQFFKQEASDLQRRESK